MHKIKLLVLFLSFIFLGAACTPGSLGVVNDAGVWVSADQGEHWRQKVLVYGDRTTQKTISDVDIQKIVFSPQDSRKIFGLSRQTGLWVSWNAGNNWDSILSSQPANDLAIDPINPKIYYVAIGSSIAKTENDGDSFRAIFTNDKKTIEVNALAIRPDKTNIIYAGTSSGELMYSENSGATWRILTTLEAGIKKLAIHPENVNILYAGISGKGLAQSVDGGKNWAYFTESFKNFSGTAEFRDFVFLPKGILYASRYGLLRSLNQGKDWVSLPLLSSKDDSNIYSLAINSKNPLEIYYGTRSTFYHSIDGGFNWIPRTLPSTRAAMAISIDPNNQSTIYLGVGSLR